MKGTSAAFRTVAYLAVLSTYLLIVMGAVVRASGSGLGCPDWPLCYGQVVPPGHIPSVIEYSHRVLGAITSCFIVASIVLWLRASGFAGRVAAAGIAIGLLLAAQIALGAVTVMMELPPLVVMAHLGLAMALLGALVAVAVRATPVQADPTTVEAQDDGSATLGRFRRLATSGVIAVYALILAGGYVRASGATWGCLGFPTCNGALLPFGANPATDIQLVHRFLAYAVSAHLIVVAARAWRMLPHHRAISWTAGVVVAWLVTQIAIGATMVSTGVPPVAQVLHVAGAAGLWLSVVALAVISYRISAHGVAPDGRAGAHRAPTDHASSRRSTFAAYLNLTKPRIIVLLLATTLAAMILAANGLPPLHTVLLTMLGGAFGAGAANAVNCCIDRDIDAVMKRTSSRAIPAGRVDPPAALRFGVGLAAMSFGILAVGVNLLAASLTIAAFGFYVLVYTRWLKRSTVHNIVIGGAAGAVPPVVGWAAVTGNVSLLAIYLFAIIFFWTPPHFWALALLIKRDYAEAGVPMLPVVRGDAETRRQILLYTALLALLTVSVVAFGLLGPIYLAGAIVLGGLFVALAVQLSRQASDVAARRLFRYSLLYLPALFSVMIVDRLL